MNWRETKGRVFFDGDQILAAVPCRDRSEPGRPRYFWDIAIVTVDDDGTLWVSDGDVARGSTWGWQAEDIEWFVPLDEIKGELPPPSPG